LFQDLISHCHTVAVLPMIDTIKDAIESRQLAELHVPKVDWASTVALVFRTGEGLSPDTRRLRDETRTVMCKITS
jgi:hypothetical protein